MNASLWNSDDLAAALGVAVPPGIAASGVSIDTRTLKPGELFIALPGEKVDGHVFAAAAIEKGAAAVLVSQPVQTTKQIRVADTAEALNQLARYARDRSGARRVAITGSVGKTTTKELLALALSPFGRVHKTGGNLNNHYGLPLTLAHLPSDAHFAVLELGMSAAGELTALSALAQPEIAMVTHVAAAHLAFFNSVADIAHAKAEIFSGLPEDGIAIYPADNVYTDILADTADEFGVEALTFAGKDPQADAYLLSVKTHAEGQLVEAMVMGQKLAFHLPVPGAHVAVNCLPVLLAVHELGFDLNIAANALANFSAVRGRGEQQQLNWQGGTLTLIDESYNASPAAMQTTITMLGQHAGRKIAVLGDMLELGETSPALHAALADDLLRAKVDQLFACGPHMQYLFDTVPTNMQGAWAENSAALAAILPNHLQAGDVVLVKGSAGSQMKKIIETLKNI